MESKENRERFFRYNFQVFAKDTVGCSDNPCTPNLVKYKLKSEIKKFNPTSVPLHVVYTKSFPILSSSLISAAIQGKENSSNIISSVHFLNFFHLSVRAPYNLGIVQAAPETAPTFPVAVDC